MAGEQQNFAVERRLWASVDPHRSASPNFSTSHIHTPCTYVYVEEICSSWSVACSMVAAHSKITAMASLSDRT